MWQSLHTRAEIDVPEKSVLDIGCTTGAFLAEAKADGWRVHGVHLLDPLAGLVDARTKVMDGGFLFIELPQWGALGRRKNAGGWSQLRPPEHINFFSKGSLRVALDAAGWDVVRQETIQPNVTNTAIEHIRHGRTLRGSALAIGARVVERAGLGGYLRCLAAPR